MFNNRRGRSFYVRFHFYFQFNFNNFQFCVVSGILSIFLIVSSNKLNHATMNVSNRCQMQWQVKIIRVFFSCYSTRTNSTKLIKSLNRITRLFHSCFFRSRLKLLLNNNHRSLFNGKMFDTLYNFYTPRIYYRHCQLIPCVIKRD